MNTFLIDLAVLSIICVFTEAIFTGVADQVKKVRSGKPVDWELPCRTWLWSMPVYGLSATLSFLAIDTFGGGFHNWHWILKGSVFVFGIYFWEFLWGWILEKATGRCPWQYQYSRSMFWRFCKPAYAPFWFLFGFMLEWVHITTIQTIY